MHPISTVRIVLGGIVCLIVVCWLACEIKRKSEKKKALAYAHKKWLEAFLARTSWQEQNRFANQDHACHQWLLRKEISAFEIFLETKNEITKRDGAYVASLILQLSNVKPEQPPST
jgi:hypothetical protein